MLSGFLSNAMNFQNVEGSIGQNVLVSAMLELQQHFPTLQLQCSYNGTIIVT